MYHPAPTTILAATVLAAAPAALVAQGTQLDDFYGFNGMEVVRIDPGAGPIISTDLDGDGDADLVVVNNYKNRIELHHQKKGANADDEVFRPRRANDLPEHWRFRRDQLPAVNRVTAVVPHDFNDDGLMDLVYAGQDPAAIVFLAQTAPGEWAVDQRHFINGLMASRDGIAVADLVGDEGEELIAINTGRVSIWPMDGSSLGPATELSGGDTPLAAFFIEDIDGNGMLDLFGVSPDDSAPVRMWLSEVGDSGKTLGAQLRFEMPPLREAEAIRVGDRDRALLAVIEKPSKRVALLELDREQVRDSGDREAAYEVFSFLDPGNRNRRVVLTDLTGDGAPDVLATNTDANAISIYMNEEGGGLSATLSHLRGTRTDGGDLDGDGGPRSHAQRKRSRRPQHRAGRRGASRSSRSARATNPWPPRSWALSRRRLAVVTKSGRKYALDLLGPEGIESTTDLGSMSRAPEACSRSTRIGSGRISCC